MQAPTKKHRTEKAVMTRAETENLVGWLHFTKICHGKRPIGKAIAKKLAALFKTDYRIFL